MRGNNVQHPILVRSARASKNATAGSIFNKASENSKRSTLSNFRPVCVKERFPYVFLHFGRKILKI
jgi:hypothetical protein